MTNTELMKRVESEAIVRMTNLRDVLIQKKKMEESEKKLKAEIKEVLDKYGVKSITTPVLKITNVEGSKSTTVDLEAFRKMEPEEYESLLNDYPKVTMRSSYLKFDPIATEVKVDGRGKEI